jgi:hypothetical protein
MSSAIFQPTDIERRAIDELKRRCREVLSEHPEGREALIGELGLRERDVTRLMERDDWTLPAAIRIAQALRIVFDLRVV